MNIEKNRERYQGRALRRLSEMGTLVEYVAAEKELAIYHAHRAGVPIDDIAHRARQSTDEINAVIDAHRRAKDIPDLDEDCPRMLCPSHILSRHDDPSSSRILTAY